MAEIASHFNLVGHKLVLLGDDSAVVKTGPALPLGRVRLPPLVADAWRQGGNGLAQYQFLNSTKHAMSLHGNKLLIKLR